MKALSDAAAYPMERAPGCPFDPSPKLAEWQRDRPIARVELWSGQLAWVVTRYADQRAILADPRVSTDANHPGFPHSQPSTKAIKQGRVLISLDEPAHGALRKMLVRDFTVKRIESMRPRVQQLVDALIDDLVAGPAEADLVAQFALPLPSLMICDLLGVPHDDQSYFQDQSELLLSTDAGEHEAAAAIVSLKQYLDQLVDVKTREPGDDLITRLVEHLDEGHLTRDEVVTQGFFLLVAGHETTANMISLGTLALLQYPEQLAELRDSHDPQLVANAVEELLRYLHTPHSGRTRVAVEDIEIGGLVIRAGDGIITAGNIADRDPEAFDGNTNVLDIHREARHHTAFGFGVHQCLGQPLARMELQVVFSTLFRRIPTLRLAVDLADVPFKLDRFVYGVHRLPVTW